MASKSWNSILNTPPQTPVLRHFTGDPDVGFVEVSETVSNMANNAVFIKLPEFWEHAAKAWFSHVEAQFAVRGITEDELLYNHVVAALGCSTTSRMVGFLSTPPIQAKYAALKAHLLKTFELSIKERARRLFAIQGLGDSKPSELMEKMLNLLGEETPNFLFIEMFLRHMPPRVQTALANTTAIEPRALAEEADRFFLATQHPIPDMLAPALVSLPPVKITLAGDGTAAPGRRKNTGLCIYHTRFGAKARRCRSPCSFKPSGNVEANAQ